MEATMVKQNVSYLRNDERMSGHVTDIQHHTDGAIDFEIISADGKIDYVPAESCTVIRTASASLPEARAYTGKSAMVARQLRQAAGEAEYPKLKLDIEEV